MTEMPRTYLQVRVIPRASRTALGREADGRLRVHLTAAPVEGAANRALIALLAERLDLPKGSFEITRGGHGRDKRVCVSGITPAEMAVRLAAVLQSHVDKANRRG